VTARASRFSLRSVETAFGYECVALTRIPQLLASNWEAMAESGKAQIIKVKPGQAKKINL